jgi:multidrug efflux pump subunit AcrA (membrane-fusion protein)
MSPPQKWIGRLIKCVVLLLGVWGLYVLWHAHSTAPPVLDDDDIKVPERVPVHVGTIQLATLHQYLSADGVVEPEPARGELGAASAVVSTPTASVINDVYCKEGERVKKGDALFITDKGDKVFAPLDGTVVQLNVHPGEIVTQYSAALQVVDLDRLVIAVAVPSSQVGQVKVGQSVEIDMPGTMTATTRPAERAVVTFVDPAVDGRTDMGSVDVSVPGDLGIRLGQFVHVKIETDVHRDVLAVPEESVANDAKGRPSISVVVRDFRWAVREPVTVGLREGGLLEISGNDLKAGVDIVTTGAYALPDESKIEVDR